MNLAPFMFQDRGIVIVAVDEHDVGSVVKSAFSA